MNRLIKTVTLLFLLLFTAGAAQLTKAQSMGPLSGAEPKSFSLSPDNAGFLENSVNLFNGQVQFPFPLMSLSGRGGSLSYSASIFYNSANAKELANVRNLESPTGPFGLGWSIDRPRIIADHKGTGSRDDDDFYLQEGGTSYELIPNGSEGTNNSIWVYKTKQYQPWKITYDVVSEVWQITRENGMKYRYGNVGFGQNAVQTMVRWGNWIGHSAIQGGQEEMIYIWDLAEIEDAWGDKLLFSYELEEEHVSDGTTPLTITKHTKASYLKQISNLAGRKIVFTLENKDPQEYTDPHTETVEPDPYQEKFETKYVSKVGLYNEQDVLLKEIEFGYGSLQSYSSGYPYKRTLTAITQKDGQGVILSGADYNFVYERADDPLGPGALSKIVLPTNGGSEFFFYEVEITNSSLSYTLPEENSYKEPKIFIGGDYTVVTRRNVPGGVHSDAGQSVIVDVLTWDAGKWNTQRVNELVSVNLTTATDGVKDQNFQIVIGKDFFATLNKPSNSSNPSVYNLHLYKRDPNGFANWIPTSYTFTDNISTGLGASPRLLAGEDFVLIGGLEGRHIKYEWIGSVWDELAATKPPGTYYYGAINNYFITHNVSGDDDMRLYYKNGRGTWKYGTFSETGVNVDPTEGPCYWHLSNGFALLMAAGKTEYIYRWNHDYADTPDPQTIDITTYSTVYSGIDSNPVVWTNNSMVAILKNTEGGIFRFDGEKFIPTTVTYHHNSSLDERYKYSFSDDMVLHLSTSTKVGRKFYDPVTGYWITDGPYTTSQNLYEPRNIIAGNGFMAIKDRIYFRNTDGSYTVDPIVIPNVSSGLALRQGQGGFDFIVAGSNPSNFQDYQFKNGKVLGGLTGFSGFMIDAKGGQNQRPSPQVGFNTIVSYPNSSNHYDQGSITIFRKQDEQFAGTIKKWVVSQKGEDKSLGQGSTDYGSSFVYTLNTASLDPSGSIPQFNEIKTSTKARPQGGYNLIDYVGHTINYFFNGLPPSALGNNFPSLGGNTTANYRKLNGLPYRTEVHSTVYVSGVGNTFPLVSESVQDYVIDDVSPYEYRVRPHASSSTTNGITTGTTYTYNAAGQLATETTTDMYETIVAANTYWWEVYDPARTTGRLTPVVSQTRTINGEVVEASATRWKYWSFDEIAEDSTKVAPYKSYTWKKNGSSAFSAWVSEPSSSTWQKENEILSYDLTRGLPIDTKERNGMITHSIYDPDRPLVLASSSGYFSEASVQYEGFETIGNNTTALAGKKSNDGTYTINGVTGSPKLTYWQKVGAGNWEFIETTATNGTIGGTGTLLDEVRIFPSGGYMTTYSYDDFGNILSSNDLNNILSHYEYDSFGRLKLIRDQKKNILKSYIYNFQN
ncbi:MULTISPECIES: SpvB/TcaC N-terminal domain-containing protein [unclassified Imperialibacter]|uniref:SpvB/TcaC N-terminal domain-containing protein n=1 Tax=unclassified Imperialibacter TaxID=2629706 RepID=UPI00186A8CDC|nr:MULTISPECIES: SpvB/TcaC N-terminal domain-containing protein [unclassified Imperialibacter]